MEDINHILKQLKTLNKSELHYVVLQLLIDKSLKFEEVVSIYVKYLENLQEKFRKYQALASTCIASSISKSCKDDWLHSQAHVLIEKHIPSKWIKTYLSKSNKEMIERNRKFL